MDVALVTGGSGLVGRALIERLAGDGVRVLATARSRAAAAAVTAAGGEVLHTDVENLGAWARETVEAEVVFHLALPRLSPPVRRAGALRRRRAAVGAAAALGRLAAGRPLVLASSGLVYGPRSGVPAADEDPAMGRGALARTALDVERALSGTDLRAVRLPWVYGPGGLARDLIVGLRTQRFRVVGPGDNPWALLSAQDAAGALVAAAASPPGAYTAAEEDLPTQLQVVEAICAVPGHPRPDHAPPGLAGIPMGGALSEALAAPLAIRSGRLLASGWRPRRAWRRDLVRLAEGPLPLPG